MRAIYGTLALGAIVTIRTRCLRLRKQRCSYFTELADRAKVATLRQRVVVIAQAHKSAGHESPTAHPVVREVLAGMVRSKSVAAFKKSALDLDRLKDALLTAGCNAYEQSATGHCYCADSGADSGV